MADAWIKIRNSLPDDPRVIAIGGFSKLNADSVVGKLVRVWGWFDAYTETGFARGMSFAAVDKIAGKKGFALAMASVDWLREVKREDGSGLEVPRFEEHNSKTARARALAAKRMESYREASGRHGGRKVTQQRERERHPARNDNHSQIRESESDQELHLRSVSEQNRLNAERGGVADQIPDKPDLGNVDSNTADPTPNGPPTGGNSKSAPATPSKAPGHGVRTASKPPEPPIELTPAELENAGRLFRGVCRLIGSNHDGLFAWQAAAIAAAGIGVVSESKILSAANGVAAREPRPSKPAAYMRKTLQESVPGLEPAIKRLRFPPGHVFTPPADPYAHVRRGRGEPDDDYRGDDQARQEKLRQLAEMQRAEQARGP